MALSNGYAVLIGTLVEHHRDTPDNQGRWYHVHLTVDAGGVPYQVAVDVDSKQSTTGVRGKVVETTAGDLGPVTFASPGQHAVVSTPGSGALDHVRNPVTGMWRVRWRRIWWLRFPYLVYQPWQTGSNVEASTALEAILTIGGPVVVWGEPFDTGHGAHNVHQNQGDPAGSQWWAENAIWQDGAVAVPRPNGGGYWLFAPAFSTQAEQTDDQGHPV